MEDREAHGSSSSGRARRDAADAAADAAAAAEPGDGRSETGDDDNVSLHSYSSEGLDSYSSEGFDGSGDDEDDDVQSEIEDDGASNLAWYDSEDEDNQRGLLKIRVNSFWEATELLEESDGPPIDRLGVFTPAEDEHDAHVVRRFVAALGRENGRPLRRIEFGDVDWTVMHEEDVERLFGEVLPTHPTLEAVAGDIRGVRHVARILHPNRKRKPADEA